VAAYAGGLIVSLIAGVRMDTLQRLFQSSRLVRAMPNTPALIGQGMTGLVAPIQLDAADRAIASALALAVGQCLWVENDEQLNAVTALSGSGPAYGFYLIEAMEQAALTLGLSAAQGRQLAVSTLHGAALLASESAEATVLLRERVTSTGGTTQAAIQVLEARCVQQAFVQAIQAAASRSREISAEQGIC
ncbi:pyrroline-5-carboxylate reductase, partial [Pseudomonas aeruginosa]